MQEKPEKSSGNGAKTVVKKEGGPSGKPNGVAVKKQADSHVVKKEAVGKSTNGVKIVPKKEVPTPTKPNGTIVKRELDKLPEKKKVASSSSTKTIIQSRKMSATKTKTVEKKVFTLPGQKREPPEERDPLRIFYETLHEQIPDSEMAEIWMMEHGLLEAGHAKQVLERKQRRQTGTPVKSSGNKNVSSTPSKTSAANGTITKTSTLTKTSTTSRDSNSRLGNKGALPNGKSNQKLDQKGKRKRDADDDEDDEFVSAPSVRRKLVKS